MSIVNCSGIEKEILECDHINSLQGLFCNPAGIVCQGIYSKLVCLIDYHKHFVITVDAVASNCTTGDVRLVGSIDGDEGRLEVCVNSAWGTVCSDGFDTNDASVACQSLEGFSGSGESCLLVLFFWPLLFIYFCYFLQTQRS